LNWFPPDLLPLTIHPSSMGWQRSFLIDSALASLAINVLLFCYLYLWLEGVCGVTNAVKKNPWAEMAGATSLATAFFWCAPDHSHSVFQCATWRDDSPPSTEPR
jgi:hypothetical protein